MNRCRHAGWYRFRPSTCIGWRCIHRRSGFGNEVNAGVLFFAFFCPIVPEPNVAELFAIEGVVQKVLPDQFLESTTQVATGTGNGSDSVDERTNGGHVAMSFYEDGFIVLKIGHVANWEGILTAKRTATYSSNLP